MDKDDKGTVDRGIYGWILPMVCRDRHLNAAFHRQSEKGKCTCTFTVVQIKKSFTERKPGACQKIASNASSVARKKGLLNKY